MTYRVAMDIGGTFTDVVAYDESSGAFTAAKAPTTPGDLAEGVFGSLARVVRSPGDISFFVHGTTQGLNALLERKGARVLLLTTAGMRDVCKQHAWSRPVRRAQLRRQLPGTPHSRAPVPARAHTGPGAHHRFQGRVLAYSIAGARSPLP